MSDAQPSNWASLCLNSCLFSFCSNDGPHSLNADCFKGNIVRFYCARAVMENFWRALRADLRWPSVLSALDRCFSCSSPPPPPLPRCCCCQPSRCTALHRAVTKLDDALPHGLLHRRESRSSTRACYRSNRPSHSVSRRRLPLRGAPRTQLLPASLSQRQPVGVHAARQTTN